MARFTEPAAAARVRLVGLRRAAVVTLGGPQTNAMPDLDQFKPGTFELRGYDRGVPEAVNWKLMT